MTAITPFPPAPSRQQPLIFADRADAWLSHFEVIFVPQFNAANANVNAQQASAVAAANSATASASAALASEQSAALSAGEALALTVAYQGALPADPTLNKTGGPLVAGDWYINTATASIRVFDGSAFVQSVAASAVLTVNGMTGDVLVRPRGENVVVVGSSAAATLYATHILTASVTLTLPGSPAAGDWVSIQNSSGTTTAVIARNGSNIMSLAEDLTIDADFVSVTLVYADATRGWVFR